MHSGGHEIWKGGGGRIIAHPASILSISSWKWLRPPFPSATDNVVSKPDRFSGKHQEFIINLVMKIHVRFTTVVPSPELCTPSTEKQNSISATIHSLYLQICFIERKLISWKLKNVNSWRLSLQDNVFSHWGLCQESDDFQQIIDGAFYINTPITIDE